MRKILTILLIAFVSLTSCTDKEKREKALKALEQSQQLKADFEAQIEGAKNRVNALEQQLAVAEDNISRVKEFQLLRAPDEKEQQIKNAVAEKQRIEAAIVEAKALQHTLNDSLSAVSGRIQTAKDIISN